MSTRLRNFIVLLLTVFSIVSITKTAFSDNRYWVNGSGSWHDTNHWSEASGGKPGASVPTYADNVIFDNNSFTAQGQQVVIKGIAECNDFRWEVEDVKAGLKSKSFLIKSLTKSEIQVHGSILINDNISNKFFGDIVLKGDQNHEMFLNEKLNSNIIIDAPDGTYVLHSDIYTNKEFQLLQGNIETSNNSIECNGFISTGSQYRSLTIEGSRIVANYIDFENSENFIINEENSRFEIKKSISNKSVKAGNNSLSVYKAGSKASLSIEDIVTDSATCYNTLTGSITVSVSGGVKPYLYTLYTATPFAFVTSKSTPDTLYTFSGLAANNYVIRVQDNGFGLLQDGPYSVLQPNEFKANSITVNQGLTCFDGSDAILEAHPSGGTLPYLYKWYKRNITTGVYEEIVGETSKIISGVSQGAYRVRIYDANGCGSLGYVVAGYILIRGYDDVNVPDSIHISSITTTNSCPSPADDGSVTISASGGSGIAGYYLIETSGPTRIPGVGLNVSGSFTGLAPGTYETYAVDNLGCEKQGTDAIVGTKTPSTAPTNITTTDDNFCPGGSATLTVTDGSLGTGATWEWYSGSCGGTAVGSGASINVSPAVTTTYYVRAEGDCNTTTCAQITITVKTQSTPPTGASIDHNNFCPGDFANITLSYTGGTLGTGATAEWYSDATFTTNIGSGQDLVIAAPIVTTTYYVRFEGDCNTTTAASVTVIIKTPSTAPTNITTTDDNFCPGGSATLTVTDGSLGTGATWEWYSGSCGGTAVGSGASINVSPAVTTTYYVRAEGDCNTTGCAQITISVKTESIAPTGATADHPNYCLGDFATITLSYTGGTLGTGATAEWYSDATFTTNIGSGQDLVIAAPIVTTTYYVRFEGDCNITNAASVIVNVEPSPTADAGTDVTLCYGEIYQITDADTTNSASLYWEILTGDGNLDNINIINPTYTPDVSDEGTTVELVLHAVGNVPCLEATDTIRLNYLTELLVTIGKRSPYLIDSMSTHIGAYVKISGHKYIGNVGVFLVSPLDSVVELKSYCVFPGFPANVQSSTFEFYNDSLTLGTVNACNPSSGRYLFSGEWKKKLHGQDPANGAWKIRIGNNDNWGQNGIIEEAALTFSDFNYEGVYETILYADSSINMNIDEGSELDPDIKDLILPITGITVSCFGECDAAAVATASGGQAPYILYEWSTDLGFTNIVATTDTVDNLCEGVYYVRVTDSHGCTAIDSVTVGSPPEIKITNATVVDNVCYGDSIGEVTLEFSGGTGALTYTYDTYTGAPKNSGETFDQLKAGTYLFTITDISGCTKDTTITIGEGNEIFVSYTITPITCNGANDGIVEITASGGLPPFNYSITEIPEWSNTTGTFTGVGPGNVYIAVRDANLCIVYSDTVELLDAPLISIDLIETIPVTCVGGGTDGEITITASGGVGTLEYSIDGINFQSSNTFTGVSPGTYTVYVRDDCYTEIAVDAAVVTGPVPIVITLVTITDVSTCYGENTGAIEFTASGGTGNFEYSIDGGTNYQASNQFTGLYAGNYTLTVIDDAGCTSPDSLVVVNQPDELLITGLTVIHTSECNDPQNTGVITFNGTGGTPAYQYAITGFPFQAGTSFNDLDAGNYTLTLQDANGCEATLDTSIIIKPALNITLNKVDIGCFGEANGSISVSTENGTAPYNYTWSTGSTASIITGLSAGTYTVTVTDSNLPDNCEDIESIEIVQPEAISIVLDTKNVYCNNCDPINAENAKGYINPGVTGGTPDFSYQWVYPNGDTIRNDYITNLEVGKYHLTITDSRGCEVVDSAEIIEDNSYDITNLNITLVEDTVCWYDPASFIINYDGYADTVFYQIWYDNMVQPTEGVEVTTNPMTLNKNLSNDYGYSNVRFSSVRLTNDFCLNNAGSFTVAYSPDLELDIVDGDEQPYDNTYYLKGASTGILMAYTIHSIGTKFSWSPRESLTYPDSIMTYVMPDSSRTYYLQATSQYGCIDTTEVYLEYIPAITPNDAFSPNGDGINDYWKIKNIEKFPNNVVKIYSRWGMEVFEQERYDSNDPSRMWDGKSKSGHDLPSGTYYYIIVLNEAGFDPITGPITIVR